MAGYSGTPLAKKLGVKPGSRVAILDAPASAAGAVELVEREAPVARRLNGKEPYDVIVVFCREGGALATGFERARARLAESGGLWVAWPKKASGIETDLTEDVVREFGLAAGLVDNKVCAVDEVWSGLRFVIRLSDRKNRR
jgi:hypothetical protein